MTQRLLFVVNEPDFFLSHRLPLANAAAASGFEVHVATRSGTAAAQIQSLGYNHHVLPLSRSGSNPITELRCLWALFKLFRRLSPKIVHLVTIKPVLYGGLAARLACVPATVAAVSGLGFVFVTPGVKAWFIRAFVKRLYRLALTQTNIRVIFQNAADRDAVLRMGAVTPDRAFLIRGSGVDVSKYKVVPEPEGLPVIVMASRLLRDKGVGEFIDAARLLRQRGVIARFMLAGEPDSGNPAAITPSELAAWRRDGVVELLGHRQDMPAIFAAANVVVLPSYREGLPKVLAEAAACGRAVVTTDVPGCRDAIQVGVSGLLVPARDAVALAAAIQRLVENRLLRAQMGFAGRILAEREFSVEKIVAAHLSVYRTLLTSP